MRITVQQRRYAIDTIEEEIDIVGEVGEDIAQIAFQQRSKRYIRLGIQLSFYLCCNIRYQLQLVVHPRLLATVVQILIDHRTGSK